MRAVSGTSSNSRKAPLTWFGFCNPYDAQMAKRELVDTGTDNRYFRSNKVGTSIVESDDVHSGNHLPAKVRPVDRLATKAGTSITPKQ